MAHYKLCEYHKKGTGVTRLRLSQVGTHTCDSIPCQVWPLPGIEQTGFSVLFACVDCLEIQELALLFHNPVAKETDPKRAQINLALTPCFPSRT